MGKEYYAHIIRQIGQIGRIEKGQKLEEHLRNVAKLAKGFAEPIGMGEWAYIAGLWHDIGKYQPDFQKYLMEGGRRGSVPHSVWGAGYARRKGISEIAFAIDGHHKGLPNKSKVATDTEPFKRNEVSGFDNIIKTFLSDNAIIENELTVPKIKLQEGLQRELFIRYLFSVLTDADWLDTESFFDSQKSQSRNNLELPIEKMIEKLEKELFDKPKEGMINYLRNQAREIALQKANMNNGFFSLNLPTGMGKTLISIAWALYHARANKLKRIFIILPYINIIDQTASELKRIFGEEWVLEHHSSYNEGTTANEDNLADSERKLLACENWNYPVIVTTTVQFFESLFSNKPSKCRKIHNIADSVVIFDEVQSFPKEILTPTLSMLESIHHVMHTSFLFCTATQPAFEKRDKFNGIENICPLIENPTEIFQKTQRVNYHFLQDLNPIDYDILLKTVLEQGDSVLTIFNTKKAALEFYNLSAKNKQNWDECYYLSTSLCPVDRKRIIDSIRIDLKKKRKILVSSTQLIEAGVDFDFSCVFRAIAPLESVIQSAGRCNREGKLPERGKVYLFQLKDTGMPNETYKACAEHTKSLIQNDINKLYCHDFFKQYYSQVINLFIEPDRNNVLEAQKNFNFETVNDSYRVIDRITEGLFIYNCSEDSRKLHDALKNKPFLSREDYRKMQVFTVQVYQSFLSQNKNMYKVMPQGFSVWYGNYDNKTGISVEPIDADKLIV